MADISAGMVMKLRKMSGQGMMDCKNALKESGGDLDEAMAILRKKGLATLAKRAGRDTTEGKVVSKISEDGKTAAMATLCCETDFVSKSDAFVAIANLLTDSCLLCDADDGVENLCGTVIEGKTFTEYLTDTVSKTGEKTEVCDYVRYKLAGAGLIGSYIHFNDKLGAMVEIETNSDDAAKACGQVATDIAMHITAINPVSVDSDSIDPAVIERERAIATEQMKNKPAEIIEKIVDGKMGKFFKDNCLVDQPFVKDDSKTVGEALTEGAKAGGGTAKIKRFIRFEIG
jgi:elongation factor Ts